MPSRNPTLKDVAQLAGVSTATVARVIHNNGYVADTTRQDVLNAVATTGYHINAIAQGLRKQRTFTIGHILGGLLPNPFFIGVATGVERQALASGYGVLIYNIQEDTEQERRGVEMFIQRRVDGIIFTTPHSTSNVELAVSEGIQVVQIERVTPIESHLVLVDQYTGAVEAVEHLIALGHRRIAYIGARLKSNQKGSATWRNVELERLDGYRKTLRKYGLPVDDSLIILGAYPDDAMDTLQIGSVYMDRLLQEHPDVTAVFATSDLLAAGVLQSCYRAGRNIPDDISIIAFDNTLSPHLTPPLTTVGLPMFEIGQEAVRIIHNHLENEEQDRTVVTLTAHLITREFTGKAR